MTFAERERARDIVRLASQRAKCAKQWLFRDEFGTWEKRAVELLERTAEQAQKLGLSVEQVNSEIALALELEATTALLAHAKKRKGGR